MNSLSHHRRNDPRLRRDEALRRASRLNRWLIALTVAGTGLLSEVAAQALPGKTVKKTATQTSAVRNVGGRTHKRSAKRHRRHHHHASAASAAAPALQPPSQAPAPAAAPTPTPAPTPAPAPAQAAPAPVSAPSPAPVTSGGS